MFVLLLLVYPNFGCLLKGISQLADFVLKIIQVLIELFLFLLQFLGVKLLALAGVKSASFVSPHSAEKEVGCGGGRA